MIGIRRKRSILRSQGIEADEILPGERVFDRALTADRIARLDALGFEWNAAVGCAPVPWEERFQEVVEYHAHYGRWPSQSMGTMGDWVHRQRQAYMSREKHFMKKKFHKVRCLAPR